MSRNEIQVLINEPVHIRIAVDRVIEVREPRNAEFGEYMSLLNLSIARLVRDNMPFIRAAISGESVANIPFDVECIESATDELVAKIVGEDVAFVRHMMVPRQRIAILRAFLDVIGWKFIRENFQMALRSWAAAGSKAPKSGNGAEPPWPPESSSTSAAPIQD